MLGKIAEPRALMVGNGIAFVDANPDEITDTGNGFVTAGFVPGDEVHVEGTTNNDTNGTPYTIATVAIGTLVLVGGDALTAEGTGTYFTLVSCKGGSLKDLLKDGVIRIYSGSQPANADTAVSGTLLLEISVDGGAFAHGAYANGLEFGDAATGFIVKAAGDTWQDNGLANGTAGWFRFVGNATDAGGSDTSLPRVDGSVGTSGADLNMTSTSIVVGSTYTIDTFKLTLPEYYGA
jgi:hypothetical protein